MTWKRVSCYNRQSNEYWGEDKMGILDRFFKKRKKSHEPLIVFGLCGPIGVGAHKSGEAYYWTASVILHAWREENGTQLHTDKIRLEKRCDEEGVHELQNCLKGNMIFRAKVRMSEEGLEQYLDAFKYGMPPHGGLGIGLERLTMQLIGEDNIRETTLFPRDLTRLEP